MIKKLLIIIFALLLAVQAQAAGLSVVPQKLDLAVQLGNKQITAVWVENISNQPALLGVYADELAKNFSFSPKDFRLDPGEKQKIIVSFSAAVKGEAKITAGLYSTNLSVVAQDLDRRAFNVATGVKIPVSLTVEAVPFSAAGLAKLVMIICLVLALILLAIWLLIFKTRKPWYQKLGSSVNLAKRGWWGRLKDIL